VHWITTAASLAAVLGAAALVQPSGATATAAPPGKAATVPEGSAAPAPAGPDPETAEFPVDCGSAKVPTQVVRQGSADLDGDGRAETAAVVRCRTGFGTPPSGIYVLGHPAEQGGAPRVVETLLDPKEGLNVSDFAVRDRTVTATLLGYSSNNVPRCCPDQQRRVKWQWRDGKFGLTALPVPGSV
jgi:hypothetical protein